MTAGCYYRRLGNDGEASLFASTDHTRSNWTNEIQHGSPPLALLTKTLEEMLPPGMRIARLAFDILGAIPVAAVAVRARVARPGRRICLLEAQMSAGDEQRPLARLSAWAMAISDTAAAAIDRYPPLAEGLTAPLDWQWQNSTGYVETVDWRPQHGQPDEARVYWLSSHVGLVDDEPTTALQRLAMVVDSANGIGAVLDSQEFVYMNTDTTVHLHRCPAGRDFALRARASIGPDGVGVTTAEIFDIQGFIGTSAQALLVQRS